MNKKILRSLILSSLAVGLVNFSPIILHENNLQIVSVAYAKVENITAVGRAEFNFSENNSQLVEMAKNYARMNAVQSAKEKAGVYLKSYSRTVNGILTNDDISVVANNNAEIVDVQYKKVPYASHDVKGNATGEIGIAYEATVTVKIDSDELSRYIQRDYQEKYNLIEQNKSSQKNIAKINKQVADLKNNSQKVTATEIEKINNEILSEQKLREGNLLDDQKNYQGAISKYNEAIKLNPNFAMAYNNLGYSYTMRLKNYESALEYLNKAIQLDSNLAMAYNNRGITYRKLKNYTQEISDFNQAIKLNPNYDLAYNNRGNVYDDLKNYTQAISDFNQAIKLNPNYAMAYNNLGYVYTMRLKNYESALEYLNKAIQLDSNLAMAYNNLWITYRKLKNYEQAIFDYTQAIKLNPNYDLAYYNRGILYENLKNYSKAIDDFTKYIQLVPDDYDGYQMRGKCYQELGQTAKAQADFAKAKELGFNG